MSMIVMQHVQGATTLCCLSCSCVEVMDNAEGFRGGSAWGPFVFGTS
jgi:hypothetical protein